VAAAVVVVLGVVSALVAQANIAARDALYARPASSGPGEIHGGVAYSVEPWPSVLAAGLTAAIVGVAALLALITLLVVSRRRRRAGA